MSGNTGRMESGGLEGGGLHNGQTGSRKPNSQVPNCRPLGSYAAARSPAFCQRSSGFLARHFLTTRSNAGGVNGRICVMGAGSVVIIDAIKLARLLPLKAAFPVAISYVTEPSAKISVLASASFPSNCSGAMYWNVPTIIPAPVSFDGYAVISVKAAFSGAGPKCLASPKSISLAPVLVSMMLAGFRSRCVSPTLWAVARASASRAP